VSQKLLTNIAKEYKLSENQNKIKKFNFPFKFWCKEVQMWKYFATKLSFSNVMSNKIVKFDLRYFKDSNVDTVIGMNYEYFNYQRTIANFLNFKKQKFHKIDTLENIFKEFDLK
jgi:Ni,Fe-hydrogenase III component G